MRLDRLPSDRGHDVEVVGAHGPDRSGSDRSWVRVSPSGGPPVPVAACSPDGWLPEADGGMPGREGAGGTVPQPVLERRSVMLSRSERARLAELQLQLERDDPELVRRFTAASAPRPPRWWTGRALLVVGVVGVLVGVLVGSPVVLVVMGAVPLLARTVLVRRRRRRGVP
jgi:hypothetical protein